MNSYECPDCGSMNTRMTGAGTPASMRCLCLDCRCVWNPCEERVVRHGDRGETA